MDKTVMLSDVNAILDKQIEKLEKSDRRINAALLNLNIVKRDINQLPVADVHPVVRCKNCKHRDPEDHKCDCGQRERAGCVFPVDDNYFCAYGEES